MIYSSKDFFRFITTGFLLVAPVLGASDQTYAERHVGPPPPPLQAIQDAIDRQRSNQVGKRPPSPTGFGGYQPASAKKHQLAEHLVSEQKENDDSPEVSEQKENDIACTVNRPIELECVESAAEAESYANWIFHNDEERGVKIQKNLGLQYCYGGYNIKTGEIPVEQYSFSNQPDADAKRELDWKAFQDHMQQMIAKEINLTHDAVGYYNRIAEFLVHCEPTSVPREFVGEYLAQEGHQYDMIAAHYFRAMGKSGNLYPEGFPQYAECKLAELKVLDAFINETEHWLVKHSRIMDKKLKQVKTKSQLPPEFRQLQDQIEVRGKHLAECKLAKNHLDEQKAFWNKAINKRSKFSKYPEQWTLEIILKICSEKFAMPGHLEDRVRLVSRILAGFEEQSLKSGLLSKTFPKWFLEFKTLKDKAHKDTFYAKTAENLGRSVNPKNGAYRYIPKHRVTDAYGKNNVLPLHDGHGLVDELD